MIDECIYRDLMRVYGSLTYRIVESIFKPSMRLYLRVNTMYISRGELIDRLRSRGIEVYSDPYVVDAVYIPLRGPNRVEDTGRGILVDRFAAESIMLGANLYAPGVIRYDEFSIDDILTVYAPNNMVVANVRAVVSSKELKNMRRGLVAVNINPLYYAPPIRDLEEYSMGLFYPQSLPAILTTHIMDPGPGDLVVDMNAAPGGKTSHIVQYTRGLSRVVAFERNNRKAMRVYETLKRLRLYINVVIIPADSRYIDTLFRLYDRVDRILIDPPCTGLGVRPKIAIGKRCSDLRNSYLYQRQFFTPAYTSLRRGGRLIYSTCTLTMMENEYNMYYLRNKYGLKPVDLGWIPYADKVYYDDIVAYRFHPLNNDMNGYFIAVFEK